MVPSNIPATGGGNAAATGKETDALDEEEQLEEGEEGDAGSSELLGSGPVKDVHGQQEANANVLLPPPYQSTVWSDDTQSFVPPSERLAKFYRIYNKVLLDNIAIDKERTRLSEENAQLEDLIAQYLDGLSLNQRVLDNSNPLFVVNGR